VLRAHALSVCKSKHRGRVRRPWAPQLAKLWCRWCLAGLAVTLLAKLGFFFCVVRLFFFFFFVVLLGRFCGEGWVWRGVFTSLSGGGRRAGRGRRAARGLRWCGALASACGRSIGIAARGSRGRRSAFSSRRSPHDIQAVANPASTCLASAAADHKRALTRCADDENSARTHRMQSPGPLRQKHNHGKRAKPNTDGDARTPQGSVVRTAMSRSRRANPAALKPPSHPPQQD